MRRTMARSARRILRRRFAGHFGCMARISCQSQPVFGCMARESCRELAIFPSEAAFGMHGAQNLPRIDARERTARVYCHCQSPENALGHNPATFERPETHFAGILPSASARERIRAQSCHRQAPGNTPMKNLHNRHLTIVYKTLTRNQAEYNKEIGF